MLTDTVFDKWSTNLHFTIKKKKTSNACQSFEINTAAGYGQEMYNKRLKA